MNLAEFSMKKQVITITVTLILLFVGLKSFDALSRLEDPEYTIKDAIVVTPYPGASAREVEEEVTNVVELAIQQLGQLEWIESTSSRGMSSIKLRIKDKYDKNGLPQVWDELRRKVNDVQTQLPPGAGPSFVNDDFGDVFGVLYALTGDGYSYRELYDYAKILRRELLLVKDVKKITLYGNRPEVVWVEMSRPKMAALGISQDNIFRALQAKNLPADAGRVTLGPDYIPINPTGEYKSEQEFGDLLVSPPGSDRLVFLRDVADIRRGYQDPPSNIVRFNGEPAIAIGVATVVGGNVVTMGNLMRERLEELEEQMPLGMEMHVISDQSESVTEAINGFVINLLEAVAIVVVVLLFAMGLRSGLLIGFILFLTICGTFIFMKTEGVMLERISLGALIIALGMLVDNAIVVVDGMKVRIENGEDALSAGKAVVGQTAVPLLGATAVAIMAFAAIGTSQDSTGEYCRSLFTVILISLSLSWVTAVTSTPLLVGWVFKPKKKEPGAEEKDPYGGPVFRAYRKGLVAAIRARYVTIVVVVAMFGASLFGFRYVKQMFFPNSTRPQFFVEFFFPEGTHINDVESELVAAEEYLEGIDGSVSVVTMVGGGDPRFLLTYVPGKTSPSFGSIFVEVDSYTKIDPQFDEVQRDLQSMYPDAVVSVRKFLLGPGEGGKIQMRIAGPDPVVLRELAGKVKDVWIDGGAKAVRDEWREKVKVVRPLMAEAQSRQLGIGRPQLADALKSAFEGKKTGVYREGEELLSIIARAPEEERLTVDNVQDLQIWSPVAQQMVPVRQILTGFETASEDANIMRRDRTTMIKLHCDPYASELPSELLARIKVPTEQALGADLSTYFGKKFGTDDDPYAGHTATTIPIKYRDQIPIKGMPGYYFSYGGENEDSAKAQASLAGSIPIFAGLMVVIVVFLFNAVRQPLIIWCTVPLSLIGVTVGLLAFKQPFGFMALLGLLSLSGMLIKNAIVLIDQIDLEIREGKDRFQAVVDSGVGRMRPVMLAAATTILGMIPLLSDAFFVAMAVTIMMGLLFATVLTLVFVPVLYAVFFRIPNPK